MTRPFRGGGRNRSETIFGSVLRMCSVQIATWKRDKSSQNEIKREHNRACYCWGPFLGPGAFSASWDRKPRTEFSINSQGQEYHDRNTADFLRTRNIGTGKPVSGIASSGTQYWERLFYGPRYMYIILIHLHALRECVNGYSTYLQ